MKPEEMKVLVIGQFVWGIGDTLDEALRKMRKNGKSKYYLAYIAHPKTYVDDGGSICFPEGFRPKEFHRVAPKKQKA